MPVLSTISSTATAPPDFTKLAAWEAWAQDEFGTTPDEYVAECVNDFPGGVLSDTLLIQDWGATTAANHPTIRPKTPADGHQGVLGDGFIINRGLLSNYPTIEANQDYTLIQGITIRAQTVSGNAASDGVLFFPGAVNYCTADSLILEYTGSYVADAFSFNAFEAVAKNCLVICGGNTRFGILTSGAAGAQVVDNCTIVGGVSESGLVVRAATIARNCVVANTTGKNFFDTTGTPINCASRATGTGAAYGTAPQTGVADTDFVNYTGDATGDYNPAPDSQKLVDKGTDPAILTLDIAGNTRNDPDEIGAYALVGAGPTPTITFTGPDIADQTGTANTPFVMSQNVADSFTVENGTAAYALSPSSNPLPAGLSVNPSNGDVVGTPTVPGIYANIIVRGTVS